MANSKTLKEAGILNKTELSLMFKMSNIKQTENPFKRNIEDEAVNTVAFDEGPFFMLTHFSYLTLTPKLEALPRDAIRLLILCKTLFHDQLHDLSLLSFNSYLQPFLKSIFTQNIS